ncbi:MAG: CPBP family intramembrane metalloprotease [Cyanobacteria bacterium SBLK]|nr:CPBP family intramembrane metalloprotease [Cyanobacteria bacterium SBLK]
MVQALVNELVHIEGWSLTIAFFLIWAIAWLPFALPLALLLKWQPSQPLTPEQKLPLLVSLYAIAPLILWGFISIRGDSFRSCGLILQPQLFISLGAGLSLGILGLAIVFTLESQWGWLQWHGANLSRFGKLLIPILALALWIAIVEEAIFRGFLFNALAREGGLWGGVIFSSLIFAVSHLLWETKDTLPQLPGLGIMGGILLLARWADDGSLGLAWGLHAGWIWGLTSLDSAALMSYSHNAPNWFIGIQQKPLAGLAGIACLLLTGLGLSILARIF